MFGILVQAKLCVDENIPVIPIPGPSALVAALSASGLGTDEFTFGNFLTHYVGCHAYWRMWCPKY
jgi:16S rRNA (cytidine1402-2'-O)-methyltransferase